MNASPLGSGSVRPRRSGLPRRRPARGYRPLPEPLEGRALLDGSLDPAFGRPDLPGRAAAAVADLAEIAAVAVQPDGGILLVGTVNRGTNDDFAAVRFGPDGALDPGFGASGVAVIPFDLGAPGNVNDRAHAVAVQPDGRILVVGRVERSGGQTDFGIARLLPDGRLDEGFGAGGRAVVAFDRGAVRAEWDDVARAVAVQADGRIVVAGQVDDVGDENDFGIVRLEADGRLDEGFGDGGRVVVGFDLGAAVADRDDDVRAVAVQGDGRIVVAGRVDTAGRDRDFGVIRLLPDGRLDPDFGAGGRVVAGFDLGSLPDRRHDDPAAVLVQPDGKVVVAGTVLLDGDRSEFGVLRLDAGGAPDPSFGAAGRVAVGVGQGGRDVAVGLALQDDGRLLVAGEARDADGDANFGAVRLTSGGGLDASFGAGGRAIVRFDLGPRPFDHDLARGAGLDAEGRLVIGGQVDDGRGGPLAGVARLLTATPPEITRLDRPIPSLRNGPVDALRVDFSEPIDPAGAASALELTRDGTPVPLGPEVRLIPEAEGGSPASYRIVGLRGPTSAQGRYALRVDASKVRDEAGNPGVGAARVEFEVDLTPPRVVRIGPIPTLNGRETLGVVEVEFGEPVDPASVSAAAVRLTRGGAAVPLGPGVTVSPAPGSATTFLIAGLGPETRRSGAYELSLEATGVRDLAGNAGVGSGSTSFVVRRAAVPSDYDGDRISDPATFTIVDGVGRFEFRRSSDGAMRVELLGGPGDFPVDGDYDGDGVIDPAVFGYDAAMGYSRFLYRRSSDGEVLAIPFGGPGDFPVAGDYDGDGITDVAVYGYSAQEGFSRFGVLLSSTVAAFSRPFGGPGDFPVAGDYDGDGRTDIAVFGFSGAEGFSRFGILPSGPNDPTYSAAVGGYPVPFGGPGDSPVVGDFDGDGIDDVAVYGYGAADDFSRFGIRFSGGRPTTSISFGGRFDLPVAGDYDGDGTTDIAVFGDSPANGFVRFAILPSGGSPARTERYGAIDSIGLPASPGLYRLPGGPAMGGSADPAPRPASAMPPIATAAAGAGPHGAPDAPPGPNAIRRRPRPFASGPATSSLPTRPG